MRILIKFLTAIPLSIYKNVVLAIPDMGANTDKEHLFDKYFLVANNINSFA